MFKFISAGKNACVCSLFVLSIPKHIKQSVHVSIDFGVVKTTNLSVHCDDDAAEHEKYIYTYQKCRSSTYITFSNTLRTQNCFVRIIKKGWFDCAEKKKTEQNYRLPLNIWQKHLKSLHSNLILGLTCFKSSFWLSWWGWSSWPCIHFIHHYSVIFKFCARQETKTQEKLSQMVWGENAWAAPCSFWLSLNATTVLLSSIRSSIGISFYIHKRARIVEFKKKNNHP